LHSINTVKGIFSISFQGLKLKAKEIGQDTETEKEFGNLKEMMGTGKYRKQEIIRVFLETIDIMELYNSITKTNQGLRVVILGIF